MPRGLVLAPGGDFSPVSAASCQVLCSQYEQGAPGLARGIPILGVLEAWCPVQHGSSHEGDKEAGCVIQGGSALGEDSKSLSLHRVETEALVFSGDVSF